MPQRPSRKRVPSVTFDWSLWVIVAIVAGWLLYNFFIVRSEKVARSERPSRDINPTKPSKPRRSSKPLVLEDGSIVRTEIDSSSAFLVDPIKLEPASITGGQIVRHQAYSLSYNEAAEQAWWVAYLLTKENFAAKISRKDSHEEFVADLSVTTESSVPEDFKASGYDRGHLAPAGDMKVNRQIYEQSFFMSNMSPQAPGLNRELWRRIEEKVRTWQKRDKVLYVITGPVLRKGLPAIGRVNKIAVPEEYYKIVLDLQPPDIKAIGFLTPNRDSDLSIEKFTVSIDKIERETGIDFFPQLPDDLEQRLESSNNEAKWFKN